MMKNLALLLGLVLLMLVFTAFYAYVHPREDYVQVFSVFLVIGAFWYFLRYLQRKRQQT